MTRRTLLVLDNCEQVVEACAAVVRDVPARCPEVGVLATSREPLGVSGEAVHRLGPLPLADDSVELFVARAADVAPDRAAEHDLELVARICSRLDGMPLAIELAASRCSVLSTQEIYDGLDERFRLLRGRDRTAPERQRTMTSLLDWSYDLLDQPERTVFERLAVFAGTFGLDAASAIAGPGIDLHRRAGGERDAIPDARDRACLRVGSMDRVG